MRQLLLMFILICFDSVAYAQDHFPIERYGRGSADCVAWNPASNDLLAVSGNAGVWLYDSQLEDVTHLPTIRPPDCVQWSPDGQFLNVFIPQADSTTVAAYRFAQDELNEVLTAIPDKEHIDWLAHSPLVLVTTPSQILALDSDTFTTQTVIPYTYNYVLSPSGQSIAFAYEDRIDIYDVLNLRIITTLSAHEGAFTQVAWSPSEEKLATAANDRIDVFDVASGDVVFTKVTEIPNDWTEVSQADTLREGIGPMIWNHDNRNLVVVSKHPVLSGFDSLRVWDTLTDTLVLEEPLGGGCSNLSWSPDGDMLLLRGVAGSGYPFSAAYDTEDWRRVETGLNDGRWKLSPEADLYLTGTFRSDNMRVLDADTLEIVREFDTVSHRPADWDWSPDASKFVSVHRDEIQVWDVEDAIRLAQHTEHVLPNYSGSIVWHPDGDQIMYVSNSFGLRHTYNQATLRIWDILNNSVELSMPELTDPILWVEQEIAWADDGSSFLLASSSSTRMYGASGNVIASYLEAEDEYAYVSSDVAWNQTDEQFAVLQRLESGTSIAIIDERTGVTSDIIPAGDAQLITWRHQSRILTLISIQKWQLVDADTHDILFEEPLSTDEGRPSFYWSGDGRYLASISHSTLHVWMVSDDSTRINDVYEIDTSEADTFAFGWHPSGRCFAVATDYEIRVIDVEHGRVTGTIAVPHETTFKSGGVFTLAWRPDGRAIAFFARHQPYLYVVPVDDAHLN